MTLHTLYNIIAQTLAPRYGEGEAQAIARLVLETQCQATMTDILLDRPAEGWDPKILKRMEMGEPVQYVLGEARFCGHRIIVAPGVLIPRPETEALVREVQKFKSSRVQEGAILDVCTGSGCIALAYKHLYPNAEVEAWDLSDQALEIAARNFQQHGLDIALHKVNLLDETTWPEASPLHLIVSNPPYICQRERSEMEAHVLEHEPEMALFVPDEDPLLFYRALARLATKRLHQGGHILVECNTQYTEEVAELFRQAGLKEVTTETDCFGLPRFVAAVRE